MKAIVKTEAARGVKWIDVPEPKMGEDEVLVKIEKTSICGTDVHIYEWDAWSQSRVPVPCIIGHEFAGKIERLGKNVKGLKVGQRVSAEGHLTCGRCYQCQTGRRVLCPNTVGIGYDADGCFAEYLAIPAENIFPLPDDISSELAAIFDPLGNAVHTALYFDLVGKDVLVTGAGPIGIFAAAVAKQAGARHVIITDLNDYRLELAKKVPITRAVNIQNESLPSVLKELGIDNGVDVALEMSGSAAALATLPDLVTHGGKIVLLGILPESAPINWHKVIFKMHTIQGIYGREIFRTWHQMTRLLQGGLHVEPIITHRFAARDYEKGFEAMLSGKCGKVILDWTTL